MSALGVLVAVVLLPAAAAAAGCDDGGGLYRQLLPSIVRVEALGANIFEPPRLGSGVVVAERLVVTANHVIAGAREVFVFAGTNGRHPGHVLRRDPVADLALLSVRELGAAPAVPLAVAGELAPGGCVAALGSVMRAGTGIFCGGVSLIAAPGPGDLRGILTDITAPPGLSGGALVDCGSGRLAGVVTFGLVDLASPRSTAGLIGAVPVAALLALLPETVARQLPERHYRP